MSTWSRKETSLLHEITNAAEYYEDIYKYFPERSPSSIRYKISEVCKRVLKERDKKIKKIKQVVEYTSNQRYSSLKSQAKKRNLCCDLSKKEYDDLLESEQCAYCYGNLHRAGSGLDRKDNTKGYTLDNVTVCCKSCNTVKGENLTYEEMQIMMQAIQIYRIKP